MNAKKVLTGSPPAADAGNLGRALAEVGLELWHAPEGFWTIRVKPATAAPASKPPRPRRVRRAA